MPVAAIESFDLDVSDEHGLFVDRLAFQLQAKYFSHRAVAAVAPHQEVGCTVSPVESIASTPCSFCGTSSSAFPNST